MSPRDWTDLASVLRAGAAVHDSYPTVAEQRQAEGLEAMAARCEQLAAERSDLSDTLIDGISPR